MENLQDSTPKTREETYSSSVFEWVKTERAGDISYYKELIVLGGVEYIVFRDNTRVNSGLLGDVVLMHTHPDEILNLQAATEITPVSTVQKIAPSITLASASSTSPVLAILEKAKKRKQKVKFEMLIDMPSPEVMSIILENFAGSENELYGYFVEKIEKKKFVQAIIAASQIK